MSLQPSKMLIWISRMYFMIKENRLKKIIAIILIIIINCSAFAETEEDFIKLVEKANQGDPQSQLEVSVVFCTESKNPTVPNPSQMTQLALFYVQQAAKSGLIQAQEVLAEMYEFGICAPQNDVKAFYWYKIAAEQGNSYAQAKLGVFCSIGKGVTKDIQQAILWYKKASMKGNALAQYNLGLIYIQGNGIPKNVKNAATFFKLSAMNGHAMSTFALGGMYMVGQGVPKNYILAYAWFNIAISMGIDIDEVKKAMHVLEKNLTDEQIIKAQELATEIQYKIDHRIESQEQQPLIINQDRKVTGSGTGFIITQNGYVLTCYHVIKDASEIKIAIEGNTYQAKIVRDDPNNDLALLKINGSFPAIAFSSTRSAKMGQEVFTVGYPNPSLQGVNAKITKGIVNSLTGFQDDLRLYQISVPVQPGNSGGALLDENGNVLGVIVAMLDAKTTFKITGSLPQNVNYAVKSLYAQAMIDTLPEVAGKLIPASKNKSDAIDNVKKSTVMVICYD